MADTAPSDDSAALCSAILLVVFALSLAALSGALMKGLADELPVAVIVALRFFGYFVMIVPLALWRAGRAAFRPARPLIQIGRGFLMALSTVSFVAGSRGLDYADAIAILYVYPFLITLMSPWVLGERVPLVAWAGVFGGFAGVMLVMRPDLANISVSAVYVLICAVSVSGQMVLNRSLGKVCDPMVTSMWGAGVAMLLLGSQLPWYWVPLTWVQVLILALLAAIAAISQTLVVLAFGRAPAAELAPFTYVEIVAGVVFGLALFGTWPDALAFAGIALIIVSGVLVAQARSGRLFLRRHPKI
jgi:drug/metabolite transporter (DMT)-like permease